MIHKLYQKQVEAWKERFGKDQDGPVVFSGDYQQLQQSGFFRHPDYEAMLSSRHKDTIELIEAEIKRKRGLKEEYTHPDPKHLFLAVGAKGENEEIKWAKHCVDKNADRNRERAIRNQCLDEDIAYLESQLELIKNEQ